MKYYIIAGESSGDRYGAMLMEQLLRLDPSTEFKYWGGENMMNYSSSKLVDITDTSIMGFTAVVRKFSKILGLFKTAKKSIRAFNPDAIILIDYPGFNLRIAKWAHKRGYKVYYYVAPQIWAWKKGRYKLIQKHIQKLFAILPFEKKFFKNLGVDIEYYGHPLKEWISNKSKIVPNSEKYIAIFPGSRKQELEKHLPIISKVAAQLPEQSFIISGMSHLGKVCYYRFIDVNVENVKYVWDDNDYILQNSNLALCCSGTMTLHLALSNIPQVVFYKTNALNYLIARMFVKVKFISLVNLILDKALIRELIQKECNSQNLVECIDEIMNSNVRSEIVNGYSDIANKLGNENVSEKIAKYIYSDIT